MGHRQTKAEHDRYIDDHKIAAFNKLVIAQSEERQMIDDFGPFSGSAMAAEKATRKAYRNYELWRKK